MAKHDAHECGKCYQCSKLAPLSVAIAAGIVLALGTIILGWAAASNNWGLAMVQVVGSIYHGFAPTLMGVIWGGIWGFLEGFIAGLLFSWVYNGCLCCRVCK